MDKAIFKLIVNNWQELLNTTKRHYDGLDTKRDLEKLSLGAALELREYSKNFQIQMENLFCDYRHILGMASLSAVEINTLTTLFRNITHYRMHARTFSCITLDSLSIPQSSGYQLKSVPEVFLNTYKDKDNKWHKNEKIVHPEDATAGKDTADDELRFKLSGSGIQISISPEGTYEIEFGAEDIETARILLSQTLHENPEYGKTSFSKKLNAGSVFGCSASYDGEQQKYTIVLDPESNHLATTDYINMCKKKD